mgnify:CR=1 FL=1
MGPRRMILTASLVLLMNILVSFPDDACAGHACTNHEICLEGKCNEWTNQQLDTVCQGLVPSPAGGCCVVGWRCRDGAQSDCPNEDADLLCRMQRPCP